jgi:hypothetical protein
LFFLPLSILVSSLMALLLSDFSQTGKFAFRT